MSADDEAPELPAAQDTVDPPGDEQGPHPADRPPPAAVGREVAVLAALADPTRRRLMSLLVEFGRASATALADRLPVSRQAVVKHLHVLEAAGLVGGAREGREVLYVARPGPLESSARWLVDLSSRWGSRLDRN